MEVSMKDYMDRATLALAVAFVPAALFVTVVLGW